MCDGIVEAMRKVLFISPQPFFQWRGSPIRVAFDVQALAELGYQVDLLTLPVGEPKVIHGVRVIRTPNLFFAKSIPIGPSIIKAAFDVVLFFHGLMLILRNRYDVVHCIEDAGVFGVVLAGIARSKLVFEKHSDPTSYKKGVFRNALMSAYAKVEAFVSRRASAVIGTGAGLVEQVRTLNTGKPVHHIFDIPSSLVDATPEGTARVRALLKQHQDEKLITFVGSFAVYQGVNLILESVKHVVSGHRDARFIIIGGTTEEIESKQALLPEGCDAAVSFVGKVPPDDLPDYLAAADILLSPRLAGVNTPLKILDYMKAGRAIVATETEANRLLLDDTTAILVDAEPTAFGDAILRLLADDGRRAELASAGRRLISERYNFKEFKNRLKNCYDGILASEDEAT